VDESPGCVVTWYYGSSKRVEQSKKYKVTLFGFSKTVIKRKT